MHALARYPARLLAHHAQFGAPGNRLPRPGHERMPVVLRCLQHIANTQATKTLTSISLPHQQPMAHPNRPPISQHAGLNAPRRAVLAIPNRLNRTAARMQPPPLRLPSRIFLGTPRSPHIPLLRDVPYTDPPAQHILLQRGHQLGRLRRAGVVLDEEARRAVRPAVRVRKGVVQDPALQRGLSVRGHGAREGGGGLPARGGTRCRSALGARWRGWTRRRCRRGSPRRVRL